MGKVSFKSIKERSKRKIFSIGGIVSIVLLSLIFVLIYSEYSQKNFVDAYITNLDSFEEIVDRVTIWEMKDDLNKSLAIVRKEDEKFNEVRLALSSWQVRRTFKNMELNEDRYKIDITSNNQTLHISITRDGIMNISGREYKIVSGTSVDELIEIME